MNGFTKNALQYIRNAGDGATVEHFITDHAPAGDKLYLRLVVEGWVTEGEAGRIWLTQAGRNILNEPTKDQLSAHFAKNLKVIQSTFRPLDNPPKKE